jgi:hypothetical protein
MVHEFISLLILKFWQLVGNLLIYSNNSCYLDPILLSNNIYYEN